MSEPNVMICRTCNNRLTDADILIWNGFCETCCESGQMFDEGARPAPQPDFDEDYVI